GDKVGQQRQRDKRSTALEVLGVERAALPAEIIFPVPDFFSVRIPRDGVAPGEGIVERGQRKVLDWKEQAVTHGVNESDRVGCRAHLAWPANFAFAGKFHG